MSNYELYHHGILGQKWGTKNGPPYPLKPEDHSRQEKRDNWRRSLDGANNKKIYERHRRDLDKQKKEFTDEQKAKIKKYVKIGATVAVTALAAYGAYRLYNIPEVKRFINSGHSKFDPSIAGSISIDEKTGFNKIGAGGTANIEKVNPDFIYGDAAFQRNCGNCVLAEEGRNRGLDVMARGNKKGMTISNLFSYYKNIPSENVLTLDSISEHEIPDYSTLLNENSKYYSEFDKRGKRVYNVLQKKIKHDFGNNTRGCIMFPSTQGSHWMSFECKKNKVIFKNPQYPDYFEDTDNMYQYFGTYIYYPNTNAARLTMLRTDNLEFNSNIGDAIINVSNKSKNTKKYKNFSSNKGFITEGNNFILNSKISDLGLSENASKAFDRLFSKYV